MGIRKRQCNVKNLAAGKYTLKAIATSVSGLTSEASISVIVNAPAPVVSFTQPLNNASYQQGDSLVVNVVASHSTGIQNVQLFFDNVFVRQENIAPYDWGLGADDAIIKNLAAGTHTLKAIATSVSGLKSEVSITVIVNEPDPAVSFTQPLNNASYQQGDSLVVNVAASHSTGIQNVQLFFDNVFVRQENIAPYDWGLGADDAIIKNLAAGTHTLKAIATSVSGLKSEASITIVVNAPVNLPPGISLTSPLANSSFTAPASIAIAATANDADGTVQSVSFYQGNTLLGTDLTAPYSFTWSNVLAGTYVISAKATDDKGATAASTSITVVVNPEPVTTADIVGADCGTLNASLTYEVSLSKRSNATSYSWWMDGYTQSITPVSGSTYKVIVQTGQYFTGGQLCVGVNYSVAPHYTTYCKAITICSSTQVQSTLIQESTIYPNPFDNVFTLTAKDYISSVTISNNTGTIVFSHGKMAVGETLEYGSILNSGFYSVVIVYTNGNIETKKIQKL